MKNVPKKIYLQVDDDGERPEDFDGLVGVSWCADKINDSDVEYVLAEDLQKLRNALTNLRASFILTTGDKSPFAKQALKESDVVLNPQKQ